MARPLILKPTCGTQRQVENIQDARAGMNASTITVGGFRASYAVVRRWVLGPQPVAGVLSFVPKQVNWRTAADEDGHHSFAVAL